MKKISVFLLFVTSLIYGQFSVKIKMDDSLGKRALLYKLDGSKYIIVNAKDTSKKDMVMKVAEPYKGMMKMYWPDTNQTIHFISENREINIALKVENEKIRAIRFLDDANILMKKVLDKQQKSEYIYPALVQMQPYYSKDTDFYKALKSEIKRLSQDEIFDIKKYPFVQYYKTNYRKYIVAKSAKEPVSNEEISGFISMTNDMLESSSLLRPLLVNYLNQSRDNMDHFIDKLLDEVQIDTPRGQTVLSELIDLFSGYGMTNYEEKYLAKAKGLKCTINDRLSSTLKIHKGTEIGAEFENFIFTNRVSNTKSKSLHDVKADKKIIVFWSSGCSHCKKDLPQLLNAYGQLKAQNIEIIGLSLDTDLTSYKNEIKPLDWVNDTELRGWESSFATTYNIHGTPTYFVLDKENKIIAKPSRVSNVLKFLKIK